MGYFNNRAIVYTYPFRSLAGQRYTIKVFQSGDYEYLCHMYGLSGASGKAKGGKLNIHTLKIINLQVGIAAYGA